jgi:hypothetical protein
MAKPVLHSTNDKYCSIVKIEFIKKATMQCLPSLFGNCWCNITILQVVNFYHHRFGIDKIYFFFVNICSQILKSMFVFGKRTHEGKKNILQSRAGRIHLVS